MTKAFAIGSIILIFVSFLAAENITLTSSLTCEVTPPMLKAKLLLRNDGLAAAYSIQAEFHFADKPWLSEVFPQLEPGQELTIDYLESLELENKGIYPLVAKVLFKDAGGYPMTTIIVNPFSYEEITSPSIYSKLDKIVLSDSGQLRLNITNTGYFDLKLNVHIYVPDEISVQQTQTQLELKERSKVNFRFDLKNFSALAGAVYPVWATIEYEHEGLHFTSVCDGEIEIIETANVFKKYWWLWLSLAGLIVALFIWLNRNRRSNRRPG